jgi:hypothetical protein
VTDYLNTGYNPAKGGCTVCGCQDTVSLDGVHGRRCAQHPPGYDRTHYDALVRDRGDVAAYIRTALRLLP